MEESPAPEIVATSPPKPIFACIRCSERKVKCDRKNPCDTCTKHGVQCVFRPPKTSRRRRNVIRDKAADERLDRYEALLRQNGINPEQGDSGQHFEVVPLDSAKAVESQSEGIHPNPPVINTGAQMTIWNLPSSDGKPGTQKACFKPSVIHGQSGTKLVDNSLWYRVAEEIRNGDEASDADDSAEDTDNSACSHENYAHILGHKGSRIGHPPPNVIFQLWQTFIENVDPMLKMVHVPTLNSAIERAAPDMSAVPRGFEALMFAIYAASVLSLTDNECLEKIREDRQILLTQYVNATKVALSRANFMSSTSIVVLQALMIHIIVIRNIDEPRSVWALTGVAIRIAEGIGMRVDGAILGLSPFETEIRRRIWWQIKMHDFRAAELAGQAKFRDFEIDDMSPKRPGNIDDKDLYPSMKEPAPETERPTDMLWCVFRAHLATFATSQKVKLMKMGKSKTIFEESFAMDDLKIKDNFVQEIQDMIETKYLRYCDPTQPLQMLTLVGARSAFTLMKFISHHPRRWTSMDHVPAAEKEMVWRAVIQLLEHYHTMQSNPLLKRYAWSVSYFIQWQIVIHILDTLRAEPFHQDASKAWTLINHLYEINLEMLLNLKRPVYVAVGNLCLKAFAARETAFKQHNMNILDIPNYISRLREQREEAKARKEATNARRKASEFARVNPETQSPWSETTPRSEDTLVDSQQPQGLRAQAYAGFAQGSTRLGDDAFWLNDALDVNAVTGGAADAMDVDIDTILTQDLWQSDVQQQSLDWSQWDAWLGAAPKVGSDPS